MPLLRLEPCAPKGTCLVLRGLDAGNRVWLPGESILLHSHWVLLVMDVWTRRLVGFDVERGNIDGVSVCRMFNRAIAGQALPKRISTDHDPLFRFHRWLANLRVLAIEEVKSVPYVPISHPFIERLIGTVRRGRYYECGESVAK